MAPLALVYITCIASLPWIALLALSASIELVSSSARVTSVKSQKPLLLSDGHTDPKIGPQVYLGPIKILEKKDCGQKTWQIIQLLQVRDFFYFWKIYFPWPGLPNQYCPMVDPQDSFVFKTHSNQPTGQSTEKSDNQERRPTGSLNADEQKEQHTNQIIVAGQTSQNRKEGFNQLWP